MRPWLETLHQLQGGKILDDRRGPLGVSLGVLRRRRILTPAAPIQILVGQPFERVAPG
jgi:hypothetical protein